MTCSTNSGSCRVCPGMWIAGAVLLFMLVQNLFVERFAPHSEPSAPPAAQQVNASAEGTK